jgi:serine/threonine-protein kinase
LTHPNTISIYDYGFSAEGVFYYAMELIDGATLRDVVSASGPLPAGRVIRILGQALGALKEAHEKGIIHRDVKPANVMLCERGGEYDFVKLLDFGVARKLGSGAETAGSVAGSLETLAPEVLRGEPTSPSSDLSSLSVVAYLLACGRPLFDAHSGQEVIRHHLTTEPVPPSVHNPDVSSDLEAVILRGLKKNPSERYPAASSMKEDLLRCRAASEWSQDEARRWWRTFTPQRNGVAAESEITASSSETRVRSERI